MSTVERLSLFQMYNEHTEGTRVLFPFHVLYRFRGKCLPVQMSRIHRGQCSAVCVSPDGRYIITAGDSTLKVWDYSFSLSLNFQVGEGVGVCG